MKLPGVLHSVSKRGTGLNTPGSTTASSAAAAAANVTSTENGQLTYSSFTREEKTGDPPLLDSTSTADTGVSIVVPRDVVGPAGEGLGSSVSAKNVAWEDGGEEAVRLVGRVEGGVVFRSLSCLFHDYVFFILVTFFSLCVEVT